MLRFAGCGDKGHRARGTVVRGQMTEDRRRIKEGRTKVKVTKKFDFAILFMQHLGLGCGSRGDRCSGCRLAFGDVRKCLGAVPLEDMNSGHLLIQGFKG